MPPHRKRGRPPNAFYEKQGLLPPSRQSHAREAPPPVVREPPPPTNLFSHPVFNLPIPPPNSVEAQLLNDEVDVFSFRQSAGFKFKLNNDLLENVVSKYLPLDKIVPPASFPGCVIGGRAIESEPAPTEEEIAQSLENPNAEDSHCGDLKVLKLKESFIEKQITTLESDNSSQTLDEKFEFETEKIKQLCDGYQNYDVRKIDEFQASLDSIEKDLEVKFQVKVQPEHKYKQYQQGFGQIERKASSFEEHRQAKDRLARLRQEQADRKLREEQELAEKRRLQEEEARKQQEEELRKAQEENNKRASEAATMPIAVPGSSQPGMLADSNFDDPFGTAGQNGNFEFDNNLLYGGADDLIMADDGGFGALDDQVFLGNLDEHLE
ncbi:hypothetical protein OGAPHI_003629 [Ogataea philodendri]|uniref:Uncharacterized protein n=1 Tax=Ogataea philodendri TaxID=1378263 RepID=A0A9P8P579_9ASCO|nr:uncharacterized protein OGAPHI_003629 [Ogataea philodendri]KAH3665445.1 hypothetical protein OGAPHI_003629 [Ogataea philodendri]